MFGHDNHHTNNLPEPNSGLADDNQGTAPQVTDDNAGSYIDDVSPAAPATGASPADDSTTVAPAVTDDTATTRVAAAPVTPAAPATATPDTDTLLDIKQQALQQLTPLVGHLEQSPEEKFRTTMMMIQAADNHELISAAYEAAQQITDEKVRAQALLDIVNEINYFTHNSNSDAA
jgi:hypothetical protein